MSKEIWKDIPGYEKIYQASNYGRIRSVNRCIHRKNRGKCMVIGKIIKPRHNHNGYLTLALHKNGKIKRFFVHRLVLYAFSNQPALKYECNHKNSIRDDNKLCNLEWVTKSENAIHGFKYGNKIVQKPQLGKFGKDSKISVPVTQLTKNGDFIAHYHGMSEAERETGIFHGNISKVCTGERKYAGGFIWRYKSKHDE